MWLARGFVVKARLRGRWRWAPKERNGKAVILVHCASLGEFEQGRPLIEALRAKYPQKWMVLSFFSPSGYELRKNFTDVDEVIYLPLDTPAAARKFARKLMPEMAFFIKYEYWYNILHNLHKVGTKIYLVSAILRSDASFFKPAIGGGNFFRSILGFYETIFVQQHSSADLLASIGVVSNVVVAGDTRFDRVSRLISCAKVLPIVENFVSNKLTVICGSTWPPDEDILCALMAAHSDWNFIVAPHEISKNRIDRFIAQSGRKAILYTDNSTIAPHATLLVIDCIGVLSSAYRYGNIAYIGGGFGVGIHNTLEAATWGVPVVFGPKYQKFAEARELIACGGAFSVDGAEQLLEIFDNLASNYKQYGDIAAQYVKSNIGATDIVMSELAKSDK